MTLSISYCATCRHTRFYLGLCVVVTAGWRGGAVRGCEQRLPELLSLRLHQQQQGLRLCVLTHFLSVPFKIIPLFLSLSGLVLLSGGQDADDKLHQCWPLVPFVLCSVTLYLQRKHVASKSVSFGGFSLLRFFSSSPCSATIPLRPVSSANDAKHYWILQFVIKMWSFPLKH